MTAPFELEDRRVWVAGHRGMVGRAVTRRLEKERVASFVEATSEELDLRRQHDTEQFVADMRPEVVVLAAARVGGIEANRRQPGDFLYDNLMIAANVLEAARRHGVRRTLLLGSSCIYPREAPQPIVEDALLTGPLEETNRGYAVAKIAALELGRMYRRQHGMDVVSLMPTNLYGPGDNFDPESAHVVPAVLRRVHEAKRDGAATVTLWGSGRPRREFLHADDLADAVVHALRYHDGETHLNVGTGTDVSISELADLVAQTVGWHGRFEFDHSKPDGTPRKLLDVSRLTALGWQATIGLREGLADTYRWYLGNEGIARGS